MRCLRCGYCCQSHMVVIIEMEILDTDSAHHKVGDETTSMITWKFRGADCDFKGFLEAVYHECLALELEYPATGRPPAPT